MATKSEKYWEKLFWFAAEIGVVVALVGTLIRAFFGTSLNQILGLLPSANPISAGTILVLFIYGFVAGAIMCFIGKHHMKK